MKLDSGFAAEVLLQELCPAPAAVGVHRAAPEDVRHTQNHPFECLWDSATFLISRKQPCHPCSKEQEFTVWWPHSWDK